MVTQEEIARKLGVSRQLVTFALAGYPQVSEASRQRILAAARELGYRPNPHARALRRRRTGIIALWIPDQISTHYSHVAREVNRLVRGQRQELIISEMNTSDPRQMLSNVPVDGVLAVDMPEPVRAARQLPAAESIPIVSMGAYVSADTDTVQVDLRAGAVEVMNHLLGGGYRRIAHATFLRKGEPRPGRRLAYQEAMQAARLKPEFIYYPLTEQIRPITRQFIQDYVRAHGHPEAIFCHSDDAAVGVYRGLCDLKLRVPQDVALVGCDGIDDLEYLECPLTTLVQPVGEMCGVAWQFLMRRLAESGLARQSVVLRPRLAVRESTRRFSS